MKFRDAPKISFFYKKTIDLELTLSDTIRTNGGVISKKMEENMTISEVSKKYNLTQDTLRYYEKIGILSNVPRNKSGIRNYDENSCRRIEFVKCMRDAGVEIEALLEYMQLFEKGKSTAKRRKEILEEQREKLLEKQKNITISLERLDYKIELYDDIVSGKKKDFTETI